MSKTFMGMVLEALPGATFKIKLEDGRDVLGHLAGKLRIHHIRILPGDKVTVEIGDYDDKRGRIIRRL
jgi:translation initiation factor IF-1